MSHNLTVHCLPTTTIKQLTNNDATHSAAVTPRDKLDQREMINSRLLMQIRKLSNKDINPVK